MNGAPLRAKKLNCDREHHWKEQIRKRREKTNCKNKRWKKRKKLEEKKKDK